MIRQINLFKAKNHKKAQSIDSCQPAQSAQADMRRNFLPLYMYALKHLFRRESFKYFRNVTSVLFHKMQESDFSKFKMALRFVKYSHETRI